METYISSIEYEKCNYMHPKKQKRRGSKQLCQELSERKEETNMHPIRLYKNCQKTNQNFKKKISLFTIPYQNTHNPKDLRTPKFRYLIFFFILF